MRRVGLPALILILWVQATEAQRPKVEIFSVDDGLPSAYVYDLAQEERSGRLAILTRAGVTLYDGRDFTTYTHADGLPSGGLGALAVGPGGRLWTMALWDKLVVCRFDGGWQCWSNEEDGWSDRPPGAPPFLAMSSLAIGERDGGAVAAIGSLGAGLWLWHERGEVEGKAAWQGRMTSDGLPSDEVFAVVVIENGFAVGTREGLCFLREDDLDCEIQEQVPRLRNHILALRRDPAGGEALWILSPTWMGRLRSGRLEVLAEGLGLPAGSDIKRGAVLADLSGNVYFGTPLLAYTFDPRNSRLERLGSRQGLPGDGVTAFLHDREANVWIGSTRGLGRVESRRFLTFDERSGLLEDEVSAIVEALPERYVLGHNKGLTLLDQVRRTTVHLPFGMPPAAGAFRIMDMVPDRDGSIWLAANTKGLLQLESPFETDLRAPEEPPKPPALHTRMRSPAILSVEIDAAGRLWAMSADELFVREGDDFVRIDHGVENLKGPLRWLEADREGSLFVSTGRGLLWYDGSTWRQARAPGADANILYGLRMSSSGVLWVGTLDGLYRLQGEELVQVREGALHIERPVYFILEDGDGRTWFGTDDGVFLWDGLRLRHLSVPQGLAGRETNRGAGLLDQQGRVWIGTDRGLSLYQERHDASNRTPPLVELGELEVNGERQAVKGRIELAPQENNLTFHFRTLTFSTENPVVVRYRLHPFDADWSTRVAPAGEIRYTNLPAGRYRFRIKAGRDDGEGDLWSPEVASPEIVIPRPLTRQPWFLALAALVGLASLAGGYRLRTRALLRRAREREAWIDELETKNAELERFAYTVSHDLTTPLVTIKGFLGLLRRDVQAPDPERLEHDIRRIESAADKMGRLLNELLELSRVGQIVHSPEPIDLGELVTEAVGFLDGGIAERGVELEVGPDLPRVVGDRARLLEVFQNLLENAVRFLGEQTHPRIEVGVRPQEGDTVLFVRDNGIGIDPAYHERVFKLFERLEPEVEGTGVGLTLVKRIVELHGGRVWIESEGVGHGTTVCFTLPG